MLLFGHGSDVDDGEPWKIQARWIALSEQSDGCRMGSGGAVGRYPFLKRLFADGGYQGPVFAKGQKKMLTIMLAQEY